jgi:hypothetical protein
VRSGHSAFFFLELLTIYQAGHFPCGWQGEWPKGKLLLYRQACRSFLSKEVTDWDFGLYERFRPAILRGVKEWGAEGNLDLGLIERLAAEKAGQFPERFTQLLGGNHRENHGSWRACCSSPFRPSWSAV